jgi:hypothetical protein
VRRGGHRAREADSQLSFLVREIKSDSFLHDQTAPDPPRPRPPPLLPRLAYRLLARVATRGEARAGVQSVTGVSNLDSE